MRKAIRVMKKVIWMGMLIILGGMSLIFLIGILLSGLNLDVLFLATCFFILFLIILLYNRCPKCKKLMAFEKSNKILYSEQPINILKETKRYDDCHTEIGTQEQYIPGMRRVYEVTYTCQYCGAEKKEYKTVDSEEIK